MESPLISVIVPVYKVEKYLDRCIGSVIAQTYKNLEIIMIDDESPDNCPEMCDEYARRDTRIKVIHKKNGGLSDARNIGLAVATGEYIAFVDSDDWIESDFIEILYNNAEKEHADISIIGYTLVWDDGRTRRFSQDDEYYTFDTDNAIRELLNQRKFQCMVCQKMYKKYIFDSVKFPIGKVYEDVAVGLPTFLRAKKIVVSGKSKYNYYQRNDSIVNSKFDKRKLYFLECCQFIIAYSDSHNKKYDIEAHSFYLRALMMLILPIYQENKEADKDIYQYLEQEIRTHKHYIWKNPNMELKKKVVLSLICIKFPGKILVKLWNRRIK